MSEPLSPPTIPQPQTPMQPPEKSSPSRRIALWAALIVGVLAVVTLGAWMWSERQANQEAEEKAKAAEERDAKYVSDFEGLLSDIAELETINEIYADAQFKAEEKFFAAWSTNDSIARFERLADTWYGEVWEDQSIFYNDIKQPIADLDAQPLKAQSTNGDLDAVRDAAIAHYRAWLDWIDPYIDNIDRWTRTEAATSWNEFTGDELDPLREEIDRTFDAMCATLSDEQPSDGQFSARIALVCVY
jgi:hypothetical protein